MQKWQYIVLEAYQKDKFMGVEVAYNINLEGKTISEKLSKLGLDGWELVNVVNTAGIGTTFLQYFFKRPIEQS